MRTNPHALHIALKQHATEKTTPAALGHFQTSLRQALRRLLTARGPCFFPLHTVKYTFSIQHSVFLLNFYQAFDAQKHQILVPPRDYAEFLRTSPKHISRIFRIFVSMTLTSRSTFGRPLRPRSDACASGGRAGKRYLPGSPAGKRQAPPRQERRRGLRRVKHGRRHPFHTSRPLRTASG